MRGKIIMKIYFLTIATLVFSLMNNIEGASEQESYSSYHNIRGRYSISLPTSWEKQEQDMGQGIWIFSITSPAEDSADFFFENINIIVVPADTTDLGQANSRGIDYLKRNMTQFNLIDQGIGNIGQHPASWFVHTYSYEGHTLKALKYTLINGSDAYVVTCTALPESFARFQPVFERIVASITFDVPYASHSMQRKSQSRADGFDVAYKLGALIGGIVGLYALFKAFKKKK